MTLHFRRSFDDVDGRKKLKKEVDMLDLECSSTYIDFFFISFKRPYASAFLSNIYKKRLHLNKTHKVFRHSLMHKTQSIDLKKLKKEGERSQRKPKKPPTTTILQCNLLYFTSACTRIETVMVVVANLSKCTGNG